MLSAVSQQVQTIQLGLLAAASDPEAEIELVGRQLKINTDTGIFISGLVLIRTSPAALTFFVSPISYESRLRRSIEPS
jgi:hypothetical protein